MNVCTSALTAENGTDDDSDQGKGGWSDMERYTDTDSDEEEESDESYDRVGSTLGSALA
jgi:hypothetical protein